MTGGQDTTLEALTAELIALRDERQWAPYHRPKDLAVAVSIEAGELLEHFLWRGDVEVDEYVASHLPEIASELADVLAYLLYLADALGVNPVQALRAKIAINERGLHANA